MEQRDVVVARERCIGDDRAQRRQYPAARRNGGDAVPDVVDRDAAQLMPEQEQREDDRSNADDRPEITPPAHGEIVICCSSWVAVAWPSIPHSRHARSKPAIQLA